MVSPSCLYQFASPLAATHRQHYCQSVGDDKDTCQDSDNSSPARSLGWALVCVLAFLLIAYPLSIGPVAKFYYKRGRPGLIRQFYRPLELLYHTSRPAHRFFDWYFETVWHLPSSSVFIVVIRG